MQQSRDMMVVVAHPNSAPDNFANHRSGPYATLKAGGHGSCLGQRNQLLLLVRQSRFATRSFPWAQTVGALRFDPMHSAIDGASRDVELCGLTNDTAAVEAAQHGPCPPPSLQISIYFASRCNLRNARSSCRVAPSAFVALPFCERATVSIPHVELRPH